MMDVSPYRQSKHHDVKVGVWLGLLAGVLLVIGFYVFQIIWWWFEFMFKGLV